MCDVLDVALGCISVLPHVKKNLIGRIAFHPPQPAGYKIVDGFLLLVRGTEVVRVPNKLGNSLVSVGICPPGPELAVTVHKLPYGHGVLIGDISGLVLLVCHGNSIDIGFMFSTAAKLARNLHASVFLYDYTGYGPNDEKLSPSEESLYRDTQHAYEYLTKDLRVRSSNIVVYSQSIGTVAALHLVSKGNDRLGGLVLHSSLLSGLSLIRDKWKADNALRRSPLCDVFSSHDKLAAVGGVSINTQIRRTPVLFIHGRLDTVLPLAHSLAMCRQLSAINQHVYSWWPENCGHNDVEERNPQKFWEELSAFMVLVKGRPKNACASE